MNIQWPSRCILQQKSFIKYLTTDILVFIIVEWHEYILRRGFPSILTCSLSVLTFARSNGGERWRILGPWRWGWNKKGATTGWVRQYHECTTGHKEGWKFFLDFLVAHDLIVSDSFSQLTSDFEFNWQFQGWVAVQQQAAAEHGSIYGGRQDAAISQESARSLQHEKRQTKSWGSRS